jgi:hypothetical protein
MRSISISEFTPRLDQVIDMERESKPCVVIGSSRRGNKEKKSKTEGESGYLL